MANFTSLVHSMGELPTWEATMGEAIMSGVLWSFAGVGLAVLLVGMFFRFPIPFFEYVSGWWSLQHETPPLIALPKLLLMAAGIYAFLGCIPLTILGIVAGVMGWRFGKPDHAKRYTRNIALGLVFIPVLILAVLDKIIGPW